MTLWEINQRILDAVEYGCDTETGEIIDSSALEQLQMDRDEKIENICLFIKDLKAEAAAIKAEKAALDKRMSASEKKAEGLTRYLAGVLNGQKWKSAKAAVSYRKSQAVVVDDLDMIPDEFLRIKKEPDKTVIKEALKGGTPVTGAHLEDRQSMSIK